MTQEAWSAGAVIIEVKANLAELEKNLAEAKRRLAEFDRSARGPLRGTVNAADDLAVAFNYAKNSAKGLAAVAGVGGIATGVLAAGAAFVKAKAAVDDFTATIIHARTVGVSSDFLQTLQFAAINEGVSVDKLNTALLRFTFVSEQAASGAGRLYDSLKTVSPEIAQAFRAANQEERLKLFADATGKMETASKKATLVNAAFGRSMGDLVRVFGHGREKLDQFGRTARDLGIIIDQDLLEKAEHLNSRMDVASKIIDSRLKQAFLDLAPAIAATAEATASAVRYLTDWLARAKDVRNMSKGQMDVMQKNLTEEIKQHMANIEAARKEGRPGSADVDEMELERKLERLREIYARKGREIIEEIERNTNDRRNRDVEYLNVNLDKIQQETELLKEQAKTVGMTAGKAAAYLQVQQMLIQHDEKLGELSPEKRKQILDIADAYGVATDALAALNEEHALEQDVDVGAAQLKAFSMRKVEAEAYLRVQEMLIRTNRTEASIGPELYKTYMDQATAISLVKQKLEELNAAKDLQFEADTMFYTEMEQRVANLMRQLHGEAWREHMDSSEASMIRFIEVMKKAEQVANDFAQTFVSDLLRGATAAEALRNALQGLAQDLTRMAMNMAIKMLFQQIMQAAMAAAGGGAGISMPAFASGGVATPATQPGSTAANGWFYDQPVANAKGAVVTASPGGLTQADVPHFAKGGLVTGRRAAGRETGATNVTALFAKGGVVRRGHAAEPAEVSATPFAKGGVFPSGGAPIDVPSQAFAKGGVFRSHEEVTPGRVNPYAKGGVFRSHEEVTEAHLRPFAKGGVFQSREEVSLARVRPYAKGGVFQSREEVLPARMAAVRAFAKGGVASVATAGRVVPFAEGGSIVTKPTMFPMAGGDTGLMGEAGPEAIMPLSRMPDGGLGVRNVGAPKVNVTVVEAPGKGGEQSSKQKDNGDFDIEVYVEQVVTKAMNRPGSGPNRTLDQMGARLPMIRR